MRFRVLAPTGILALVAALAAAPWALADTHTSGPLTIPVGGKIHVTCGGYASKNPHPNDLSIEWTSTTYAVVTEIDSEDHAVDVTYTGAQGNCTDSAGKPGPYIASSPGLYHVTVTTEHAEGKCTQSCSIDSESSHKTVQDVKVVAPCDGGLFSGVQTNKGLPLTDDQLDSTGIGQGLYPGQQISTGDLAVELDMDNGTVIRLGPGSHFTVPPDCTSQEPTQSAFQLAAGTIWADVVDALGGQPEVRGESAVTGVRGSIFTASIAGGKLYYHVVEGRGFYTTSSGASSNDVPAGTTLVFSNGKLVQTSTSASAWPASQQLLANLKLKPLRVGNPPDRATPVPGAPATTTAPSSPAPSSGGAIPFAPTSLQPSPALEARANFWVATNGDTAYTLESITLTIGGSAATGFKWDFGDPASGAKNSGSGRAVGHDFTKPGTYVVTLVVTTAKGPTTVRERVKVASG